MNFNELIAIQKDFDRKHGWTISTDNLSELIEMLHRDVVGLVGEVGEFANILKKLTLAQKFFESSEACKSFQNSMPQLAEELIDTFIYIMRIAAYLCIDIEKEYLRKLEFNKNRYKEYEV